MHRKYKCQLNINIIILYKIKFITLINVVLSTLSINEDNR